MNEKKNIQNILSHYEIEQNTIGESTSLVYKIKNLVPRRNAFLKYDTVESLFGVNHEYKVIQYLKDYVKVAEIYAYEYPYLITFEIEGVPSFLCSDQEKSVRLFAYALKQLHSIDITNCTILSQAETESKSDEDGELVFIHGDACLPNFIIKEDTFAGFIDLGSGGIGKRIDDIAMCVWSILYNFKDKHYVDVFFEEYGLEYYDIPKIKTHLSQANYKIDI